MIFSKFSADLCKNCNGPYAKGALSHKHAFVYKNCFLFSQKREKKREKITEHLWHRSVCTSKKEDYRDVDAQPLDAVSA